jgi:hypothetical protein
MGLFDPQGLSSSPSTQSTTNSGISSWAQPYVTSYLNKGNELINQGPNAAQQQVYNTAQNLQNPAQFGQGSGLLNQAGAGLLGTTGTALGYGQQASGAGQNYANMATDPNAIAAYMNPYIQQSLAPQLSLLNQQQAIAGQGINAKAVGQGAFGGNRATLAQGLNAQNYDLAKQQAIGQGYNEAFKNAQQAQQYGSTLGLQGLNTALQGVNQAQQGYQGAGQAGVGLGNLGYQQSQSDIARLGLQNTIANQQYNLPYQQANFMRDLMSGLPVSSSTTQGYTAGQNPFLQGIGAAGTVASYAPGIISAGKDVFNFLKGGSGGGSGIPYGGDARDIGLNETPLSGQSYADLPYDVIAEGGQITDSGVKRYASGGIASINREVMNDPTAYSENTINRGAQNNVLGGVTKLLALDTIAKQRAAMQAQQAMQQQAQPPVYQQLQQQAMPQQMAQGIDSAASNLPQQYAGGGIIAFEEGGTARSDERFPEKIQDLPAYLRKRSPGIDKFLNAFNFSNIREQVNQGTNAPVIAAPTDAKPDELGRFKAGTDSGIVIHDNAPRAAAPPTPSAPTAPTYRPADTSGIDKLVSGFGDMIRGGEDFKTAEAKAEENARKRLFLGLMNPEKGASFVSGLGIEGQKAQTGLEKDLEANQARKDKQIGQLVSLGLKGQDLKNEAMKLGISQAELEAKLPLYAAQANYYNTAKGRTGSVGLGSVTPAVADKVMERYDAYRQDYKNPNNPFVAMLDPQDQTFLREGKGKGLATARKKLNDLIDMEQDRRLRTLAGYNSKQRVASPVED